MLVFESKKKTTKLLTIVEFYNEWMLHIHQDISFFFSSQAIANCKWKNEQQTLAFKTLHKGQQTEILILYRIANQIVIKRIFKNNTYWQLTSYAIPFLPTAITFDDRYVWKGDRNSN